MKKCSSNNFNKTFVPSYIVFNNVLKKVIATFFIHCSWFCWMFS